MSVQSPCSFWGKSLWDDPSASRCLFLPRKPTSFAWLTGRHNPSYGLKSCPIWDLKREPIKNWNCNSVLWHWKEAELRALTQQNSNKASSAFLLQLLPVFFVSYLFFLFVWVTVSLYSSPWSWKFSCLSFISANEWVGLHMWFFLLTKVFWCRIFIYLHQFPNLLTQKAILPPCCGVCEWNVHTSWFLSSSLPESCSAFESQPWCHMELSAPSAQPFLNLWPCSFSFALRLSFPSFSDSYANIYRIICYLSNIILLGNY